MNNGRNVHFLFENIVLPTGQEIVNPFLLWVDDNLIEKISEIEGISFIEPSKIRCLFQIYVDKRYDLEYIKKEIEAVVMIEKE